MRGAAFCGDRVDHCAAVAEGGGKGLGLIDPIEPGADAGRGFGPAAGDEMVGGGEAIGRKAGHRGGLGGHLKPPFQGVADIAEDDVLAEPISGAVSAGVRAAASGRSSRFA